MAGHNHTNLFPCVSLLAPPRRCCPWCSTLRLMRVRSQSLVVGPLRLCLLRLLLPSPPPLLPRVRHVRLRVHADRRHQRRVRPPQRQATTRDTASASRNARQTSQRRRSRPSSSAHTLSLVCSVKLKVLIGGGGTSSLGRCWRAPRNWRPLVTSSVVAGAHSPCVCCLPSLVQPDSSGHISPSD